MLHQALNDFKIWRQNHRPSSDNQRTHHRKLRFKTDFHMAWDPHDLFFKLSFTLWELLVACYLDMKHIRMGPFLPCNAGYPAIHFASYLLAKEYSYYAFWVSGTDCLIDKKKNPSFMPLHITSNRTNSFHWSYHDGSTYNCIVCSGFLARLFEKTHASILCGLGLGQYSESGLTLK